MTSRLTPIDTRRWRVESAVGRLFEEQPAPRADKLDMHRSSLLAALAALTCSAAAPAATSNGSYKGKIDYQGYDITFKISGNRISKIHATMLQDCAGDGMSEVYSIAPRSSWTIRGGKFSGKKIETYGQSKAYVTFSGTVRGGRVKGFIREWDTVAGSGIVCDTLKRTFTAKRS